MTPEEATALKQGSGLPIGEKRRGFFVKYEIGKQNYGQVQQSHWYERTEGGILKPVTLDDSTSKKSPSVKKSEWK